MRVEERRDEIVQLIASGSPLLANELAARFGVSEDTIRRDLRGLAESGHLRRVYGGAVPHTPTTLAYAGREVESVAAKSVIARAAVKLIEAGQTVFFDAGTTSLAVARLVPAELRLTVVTHSLPLAMVFVDRPNAEVVVLGGRFHAEAAATLGTSVVDGYRAARADLCVLGASSLDASSGVGVLAYADAEVKRAMVDHAARVVAVLSGEKLGTRSAFLVCPAEKVDTVVTDRIDGVVRGAIEQRGVEVIVAT